jgi:hypothetical protein
MLQSKPLLRLDQMFPTLFRYVAHQRTHDGVPLVTEAPPAPPVDNVVELSEAEREKIAMKRESERILQQMTRPDPPLWP